MMDAVPELRQSPDAAFIVTKLGKRRSLMKAGTNSLKLRQL
jgi:hypothetical protein